MSFRVKFKNKTFRVSLILLLFTPFLLFVLASKIFASPESDCSKDASVIVANGWVDECNAYWKQQADALAPAQNQNKKDLAGLRSQLDSLNKQINAMADQLAKFEQDIQKREEDLAFTKKIFDEKTANHYRFLRTYDPISPFLADNASDAFQEMIFRQKAADQDRASVDAYAADLAKLKSDKESLEKNKADLAVIQKQVGDKTNFLAGEVAKVDAYLASLSEKQQALLAAKLASLNIPLYALSAGGCSSDLTNGKSPSFSGGFGLFTFGVPNRVGLNQYGAWGRAKAGQTDDQILHAYYNFDGYQDFSGVTISVNNGNGIGSGSIIWSGSLEDYVKRVYEVPDSWTDNGSAALKAQAIAIRSYVLAATGNGAQSICATQYCQVFKTDPKGGNWEGAVNATSGKAMVQGGQPIKAYFSSTHGGFVFSTGDLKGWSSTSYTKRLVDTTGGSVSSLDNLKSTAYDKDSPWFYCDWGSRSGEYNGTAWLKPDELADIANVILLAKQDNSAQSHLCQTDKPPNSDYGCSDTWSADTVRSKLGSSAYSTVDGVSLGFDFGSGKTTSVTISGNGHSNTFSGDEFKDYFNLRAPANIQIVGPLFNVEKR